MRGVDAPVPLTPKIITESFAYIRITGHSVLTIGWDARAPNSAH